MLIIFEGMDKAGKTTLIRELNKRTDFEHIVLDRGVISSYVYNDIYSRDKREGYNFFVDMIKTQPHLIFLCVASKDTIERRLMQANEELTKEQEILGIDEIQRMFYREAKTLKHKHGLNIIYVYTDPSIDEVLNFIIKEIETYKYELEEERIANLKLLSRKY